VDIRSQSALLAAIISLALAISVLLRPRRRALTLFSVMCLAIFAYYLGEFLSAVWASRVGARASIIFGALVPGSAMAFFGEFLGVAPKTARWARLGAALGALGGLAVALSPLAEVELARIGVALWLLGTLVVGYSLLLRRMRSTASNIERARLRYLAIGAGLVIGAAVLDYLPRFGIPFPPLGAIITTLYLFLLAQTLQRLRLLDLHELLGKTAALSVLALLFVAVYTLLVAWVGARPSLFFFNSLVASIVIVILFEPLRAKVDEWVVATLFRERFEMIRALSSLRTRIGSVIEVRDLAKLVLDTFHETRRVTHASLYLLSEERPGFWLLDSRGPLPLPFLDASMARSLITAAMGGQKAVLLENVERRLVELRAAMDLAENRRGRDEAKRLSDLKTALKQMHAGITVPMMGGDRVIGFLNLWDERVPEAYASDEIALILEIAERVATVVENSKLYERMKERDRLAALGEMAAGLAHEIRNPLGAIKGAAQFLAPENQPQENTEFLGVIVEEVDRLNTVVSQFLDYSRPLKQNFAPTDLADVVNRTGKLLANDLPKGIGLKIELGDRLPKVQGDPEQLKQVLINLLQNAVQAMARGGTIVVDARCPDDMSPWRFTESPEVVEVRVRDTGMGIAEEARQHIFVPFYTTKEKGTGLGLAICQRIVKNHGGSISVTSKAGEGSEFVIRLPAIPEPRSDRRLGATPLPEGTPAPDLTPSPEALAPRELGGEGGRRKEKKRRGGTAH
jgi:signal transduction histidine kinase